MLYIYCSEDQDQFICSHEKVDVLIATLNSNGKFKHDKCSVLAWQYHKRVPVLNFICLLT